LYFIFAFLSDQTLCITNHQSSPFLLQKCNTTLYSLASIVYHLISIIKYRLILSLLLDLLVLTHKRESHAPRGQRAEERESGGCGQGEGVAPTIGVSPEIRSPDERCVTRRDDDRESNCPLLLCLTACSTDPAENDTVYSVSANSEDDHGNITGGSVVDSEAQNEAKNGNTFRRGDMPRPLIKTT